jgi:hypothetical protein
MTEVKLDHIIYSLIPYRGYGIRAWSRGANVAEFAEALKEWFVPYYQRLVKPYYELRALVKSLVGKLYLSRIFLGQKLDELKRDGVVSHIAAVPVDLVLNRKLSLESVEKSMIEYIRANGVGQGEIEPLKLTTRENPVDAEVDTFKKIVDKEQARKILEGLSKPSGKVVVIFKRSIWDRVKLAYSLAKVLLIHGLKEFAILVDKPQDHILLVYDTLVLVLDKMIPLAQTGEWTVVKVGKEERGETLDVEETLRKIYG